VHLHHFEHGIAVLFVTFESSFYSGDFRAGGETFPVHDRRNRTAPGPASIRVVRNSVHHQQRAKVRISKTQEAVRNISEEVTRTIQFANGDLRKVDPAQPNDPKKQFCIGDTRYTYQLNKKVEGTSASNDYGLKIDRINSGDTCKSDPSGREFLQTNMRLLDFRVTPDASNKIFTVTIKVAYGDDDLLTHYDDNGNPINNSQPKDANCKSGIAGSNFCATSLLDNSVKRRLN
jgi:hypothetical protein